jgi:hypothetical protein
VSVEDGAARGSVAAAPADTLAAVRARMEAAPGSMGLPADWVFVLRGAPLGKKQEGKRTLADVGGAIVVRDKAAKASATPTKARPEAEPAVPPAAVPPLPLGEPAAAVEAAAAGVAVKDEDGFGLGSVDCAPTDTLAEARAQMAGLALPADWVFVLRGAPLGKKQEGKRTVADLGGAIVVRKADPLLSAPPLCPASAAASPAPFPFVPIWPQPWISCVPPF